MNTFPPAWGRQESFLCTYSVTCERKVFSFFTSEHRELEPLAVNARSNHWFIARFPLLPSFGKTALPLFHIPFEKSFPNSWASAQDTCRTIRNIELRCALAGPTFYSLIRHTREALVSWKCLTDLTRGRFLKLTMFRVGWVCFGWFFSFSRYISLQRRGFLRETSNQPPPTNSERVGQVASKDLFSLNLSAYKPRHVF